MERETRLWVVEFKLRSIEGTICEDDGGDCAMIHVEQGEIDYSDLCCIESYSHNYKSNRR